MNQTKYCLKCEVYLPTTAFNKHKRQKDGLQQTCRVCQKTYYKNNKDSILEVQKAWVEANKDRVVIHKQSWKARNKESVKECNSSYRKANLPKYAYYTSQRDLQKKKATPDWLNKDQKGQIKSFYEHAADCYVVSGQKYHVDHIVPIKGKNVCGLNVPWNLQVLPSDLNEKKSNKFNGW